MQMQKQMQANVVVLLVLRCCCYRCCFCFLLLLRQVLPFRSYLAPFQVAFHTSPSMPLVSVCRSRLPLTAARTAHSRSIHPAFLTASRPVAPPTPTPTPTHTPNLTVPLEGAYFFCTASLPQRPFPPSHSQKKFPLAAFPFSSSQRWPFTFSFSHPSFLFLRKIHQARNSDLTSVNHLLPANNSPPYSNLRLSTTTHPHRRHPSSGDTPASKILFVQGPDTACILPVSPVPSPATSLLLA